MADMQHIGLDPQARPTDQFAPAFLQRKLGGQSLLQLSSALKDFSADARQVYDRQLQASIEQQQRQADQISEERQFKNMQDLKGAVARGEIPMWANPWLQVRLKQDVARTEARTAAGQIYNDLQQDPSFHKDDVNAVNKFVSDRFGSLMQGRDSWEAAAMGPEIEQQRHMVISQWADQRGRERLAEAHTALGANVLQSVNDHLGDTPLASPDSAQKMPAMIADIQQQYTHLLNVVDKATASKWLSDAAFQAGRIHRDADLTRAILDNVKGQDGLKLSDLAENKANLNTLPREIQELKNADDEAFVKGKELTGARERIALLENVQKTLKPGQTYLDAEITPEQWQKLSPMGYADMQRTLAAMSQEMLTNKNVRDQFKADPILQQLLKGSIDGTLKIPDRIKLMGALTFLGEPGQTKLETFARFLNFQRDINYGDTTPDTLYDLNKAAESATLTMDRVMDKLKDGTLDRRSGAEWMGIAARMEAVGARYNNVVNESIKDLEKQIAAPYEEKGLLGGTGNTDQADRMHADQAKAAAAFRSEFYNKLVKSDGWDKLTFDEQAKQVQGLKDSIAQTYHGPTTEQWLKDRARMREQIDRPRPISSAPPRTPESEKAASTEGIAKAQKAVNDPMALDKTTTNTLAKMFDYKPESPPIHEWVRFADQSKASDEVRAAMNAAGILGEYRTTLPASSEVFDKVDAEKGTIRGEKGLYGLAQTQVKAWNTAMGNLQALKPDADKARQRLIQLTDKFNQTGSLTIDEQMEARQMSIQYLSFIDLRRQLGYTADEVKEMGEGAWRQAPMFANALDLRVRGAQVAQQLGLKDFELPQFRAAQIQLMDQIRRGE